VQALKEAAAPPPPARPAAAPRSRVRDWAIRAALAAVAGVLIVVLYLLAFDSHPRTFELAPPGQILVLNRGEPATLAVPLQREGFRGPVTVTLEGLPRSVTADPPAVSADGDSAEFRLTAGEGAGVGVTAVTVRAEGGGLQKGAGVRLAVLPARFVPVGEETREDRLGHSYFRRIACVLGDDLRVVFVLVPQGQRNEPETFYMMEDKVWVGLFRRFADANPGLVDPRRGWDKGGDPRLPALGVGVEEAYHFARWLGGNLPTKQQWDKAAGFYEKGRGKGPFLAPTNIAVGRPGPAPVGDSVDDRSLFDCRDMAGNGFEWTGSWALSDAKGRLVPLTRKPLPTDRVEGRGKGYDEPGPLLFEEIERDETKVFPYGQTRPNLGFRVAVELEPEPAPQ
jgi:hypothetical protein